MEPHFSGYVSKADLKCTDGRTIKPGAFAHQDGVKVPLVYQHNHDDITQVLGHVILKDKGDGVWGDAYLNEDTPAGAVARDLVKHGDVNKFSIWAKNLVEHGLDVMKGDIQEVSLVLAGANPGAQVHNVLMHSGLDEEDNLIYVVDMAEIKHADTEEEKPDDESDDSEKETENEDGPTVGEVLETLNDDQRTAVNAVLNEAVTSAVTDALAENEAEVKHDNTHPDTSEEGSHMRTRNPFDQVSGGAQRGTELKHSDVEKILTLAKGNATEGGTGVSSVRQLIKEQGNELIHAAEYGVENIDILFPDAQSVASRPTFIDRRQEWVKAFINGTSKTPFARVKTYHADITADEARAKGYIKGNEKVEEVFPIFKRSTGPAWIYKKQRLDREDIINITNFDVVAWVKAEMRQKLDEEIARAGLFGDGRPAMIGGNLNPDKIREPQASSTEGDGIRSIVNDHDLYTDKFDVEMAASPARRDYERLIDEVALHREEYMGSGNITAFISFKHAAKMLTMRDNFGHRIYKNLTELAGDMDVNQIVRVPGELFPEDVLMILVDLGDYNFGADKGGEVSLFDDFDIDFNQFKYLMETYISGALTLPHSAQVYRAVEGVAETITPTEPTVDGNVVSIPVKTGVVYTRVDTAETLSQGSTITLNATTNAEVEIHAEPLPGYQFPSEAETSWLFVYDDEA